MELIRRSKKLDSFDFMYSIFKEATTSGLPHLSERRDGSFALFLSKTQKLGHTYLAYPRYEYSFPINIHTHEHFSEN